MMKTSQSCDDKQLKIALFPGTFDPFTRGHESIVLRSLSVYDHIVIGVMHNSQKRTLLALDERTALIKSVFQGNERISVVPFAGLTVDLAKQVGACCIVRGVRAVRDFEYEREIAELNKYYSGLETVMLYSLPELTHISSTMVKEWCRFGKDVTEMLPSTIDRDHRQLFNERCRAIGK